MMMSLMEHAMKLSKNIFIAIILATCIGAATYTAVSKYVVHKAEENLHSIMLSHRSFHHYIQKVMHPTYYKAREEGKIAEDYYAPEILSSSFAARVMHGFFNEEREKDGLPPVYYKLAANNPRNPVNKADEKEAALIKLFNANRELQDHSEIATINGQKYLVYAKPFLETNQACIRCHGKRKDAPVGLQQIYSGQGGFNETTGVIRAIESIRVPITDDISAALVATTFSISAALVMGILYLFNLRLRQKVQQNTEALTASEENYRQFATLTSDYVHKCTRTGNAPFRIQWIGGALSTISGYSTEEMFERGCWVSIVHPDDKEATAATLANLRPGDVREIVFRIIARDHSIRWISDKCRCEQGVSDEELILYGAATDITEKRLAEELQEFTRVTVNAISDSIFWITPDGRIVDVNDAACKNLSYSREELLMMGVADVDPGTTSETMKQQFPELREQKMLHFESTHRTRDGREFPVDIVANYVRFGEEERNCAIARDISERKVAEEEIQRTMHRFTSLFEGMVEGVALHSVVRSADGKVVNYCIVDVNPAYEKILGIPRQQAAGKLATEIYSVDSPPYLPEFSSVVETKANFHFETYFPPMDKHFDISVFPWETDGFATIFTDITERKRAEEERIALEKQLLHAQKLESLGVLAGGIAHDFNNLLTSIVGNTDLALLRLNPESPVRDNLHQVELAATRAADLAKQMLAYSGKGKFVIEQIDINRLIDEMTKMLEVSISKKCVLRFHVTNPLPSVEGDATQLRQIIMNLVINASEAIGDKSGVIGISTGCMQCDRKYLSSAWLNEQIPEGLYVWLEIADTGCGMDKETISKIFDPFFTTKFTGRGLGMAAVLGIVRGHKGAIKVYSEPGRGTTFKVLLPAGAKPQELFNGGSNHQPEWKGSGTVLLVDDEETVIGIGTEMLKEIGFDVLTAMDGRQALDVFKNNIDRINFVILDLTMPHLDGEQCFRELRQLKADVKVIMSSGYNEQEVTQRFVGKGLAGFIQKPYKLSTLRSVISSQYI